MKTTARSQRSWMVALMVALALFAVAPLAHARNHDRRWRRADVERRVVLREHHAPCGRYAVWRSSRGPAIAGFLGGLFLGATLSHAAPSGFVYWDPYCHRGFASLELYEEHCERHAHGAEIDVVEAPPGGDLEYGRWDRDRSDERRCDE